MKRIVETQENEMEDLLGSKVLLMCAGYFYTGTLTGVNATRAELTDASIVYDTGPWTDKTFKDQQSLPAKKVYVRMGLIEAYFQLNEKK